MPPSQHLPSYPPSCPPSLACPASAPSGGAWAISVVQRIAPLPERSHVEEQERDSGDDELEGWRRFAPTFRECVAGILFGATIGALVVCAVAQDREDFTVPAALPTRTGRFLEAGTHTLEIRSPVLVPGRAPRDAHDGCDVRAERPRRTKAIVSPTTSGVAERLQPRPPAR